MQNKYCFSCSRFGTRMVFTVILTNYERTHKATTRQGVWNRFYWQSKSPPPWCTPFGTESLYLHLCSLSVSLSLSLSLSLSQRPPPSPASPTPCLTTFSFCLSVRMLSTFCIRLEGGKDKVCTVELLYTLELTVSPVFLVFVIILTKSQSNRFIIVFLTQMPP